MKKLPRFLSLALLAVGIGTVLATPPILHRVVNSSPLPGQVEFKQLQQGVSTVNNRKTTLRTSAKVAAQAPKITGFVCSAQTWTDSSNIGVYSFVSTSSGVQYEKLFSDPDITEPYTAGHFDGGYCVVGHNLIMAGMLFSNTYCYNTETWEPLITYNIGTPSPTHKGIVGGTYSDITTIVEDGVTYGITSYESYATTGTWGLAKVIKFPQTGANFIKENTDCYIGLAATPENKVYAINTLGYFGELDITNGDFNKISETGLAAEENCSATYNQKDGKVYFSYAANKGASSLYQIDPETGDATFLYDFPEGANVVGIYIDDTYSDDVPSSAENLSVDFQGSSLTGNLSFHIPSYLNSGVDAEGAVNYTVSIDDEEVATGSDNYGNDVTCSVTVGNNGMHTFKVVLSNAAGSSAPATLDAYIGFDTPQATSDVNISYANGKFTINWQPVNEGVNGGFISDDQVHYTVRRDIDGQIVAQSISATTYEDAVAEEDHLATYTYSVSATLGEFEGEYATSNAVTIGYVVPDYTEDFSSDDSLNGYTIIDANEDGYTWYSEFYGIKIMSNYTNSKDDWFITPSVMLEAGESYEFAFKAAAVLASYNYFEEYEICIGTEPTVAGLSTTVQGSTSITTSTETRQVIPVKVATTGRYYIGIHAISSVKSSIFTIDDIEIYKGSTDGAPAAVTGLTAVADENGELKATLTFTAPTVNKVGETLESITKIELYRDGLLFNTLENVTPGQVCTVVDDAVTYNGTHAYAVIPYNEIGEGPKATYSVFVGYGTPSYVHWINVDEDPNDPGMVTVSWQEVTVDTNGNKVPEGSIKYWVYCYNGTDYMCLGTDITETSYTHRAVEQGKQAYVWYYIYACNAGGIGDAASSNSYLVGTPYSMPYYESFADGHYDKEVFLTSSGWYLATDAMGMPASDDDNGYLLFFSNYQTSSTLSTGKVDFSKSTNPCLILSCYDFRATDGTLSTNTVDISVTIDGTENLLTRHTADGNNAWHYIMVPLDNCAGKIGLVNMTISVVNCPYVVLDDFRIVDLYSDNLTASSITVPQHAIAGEDFNVTVKVQNNGENYAKKYDVELYCDDELIATKRGPALASCYNGTCSFTVTASPLAEGSSKYYAKIVYDADLNASDDITETASVLIDVNEYPAPTELTAEENANGVALKWKDADLTNLGTARVTEDFEDYESWAQDNFGNWTTIDADQYPIGGVQDTDGNLLELANSEMAYCISDGETDGLEELLFANSGIKSAMSMYVYDPNTNTIQQSDDWLITPQLSGAAQKISFVARSADYDYRESFEVLISKTGTEIEDFELVEHIDGLPDSWTYYSYTVPAGTQYLAIRCVSQDKFLFFVDDISFTPADGDPLQLEVVGYNIYRDGVKINNATVTSLNYLDTTAAAGTHTYRVTAIYDKGESQPSAEAKIVTAITDVNADAISVEGGKAQIIVSGANGANIQVFTTDGRLQGNYTGAAYTTIPAAHGVYIVKIGAKVAKVVVE